MAQVRLYDLELNIPEQIWSPNTCKTRYALNVKNIPFETKWVNFANLHSTISAITKNGQRPTVPVIEDLANNNKAVQDSWDIALYFEEAYPETPSLFHGNIGLHKFFYDYCNNNVIGPIFKLVVLHVANNTGSEKINAWFRKNREERFGCTLEQFAGETSQAMAAVKKSLVPIHTVLKEYPFVTGDKVGWADIVLASHFTMLESLKPELFEPAILKAFEDDVFDSWWSRMEKYRIGIDSPRL